MSSAWAAASYNAAGTPTPGPGQRLAVPSASSWTSRRAPAPDSCKVDTMMRAVVRDQDGVRLARAAAPTPGDGEVAIDVAFAGVCRSDLAVAGGAIAVAQGRVLGHELAGRVRSCGPRVVGLAIGDPVTVIP